MRSRRTPEPDHVGQTRFVCLLAEKVMGRKQKLMTDEERRAFAKKIISDIAHHHENRPDDFVITQEDGTYVWTYEIESDHGDATITYNPLKAIEQIIDGLEVSFRESFPEEEVDDEILEFNISTQAEQIFRIARGVFFVILQSLPILANAQHEIDFVTFRNGYGKGQKKIADDAIKQVAGLLKKGFGLSKQRAISPVLVLEAIARYRERTGQYPSQYALARELTQNSDAEQIKKVEINLSNWRKGQGFASHTDFIAFRRKRDSHNERSKDKEG